MGLESFTWFASAYDVDDVPYRLCVLIQIAGVLIVAAGIPRLADGENFVAVLGYSVMRLGLVTMWLRAWRSASDPNPTALRYAVGIVSTQVCWWLSLLVPETRSGSPSSSS